MRASVRRVTSKVAVAALLGATLTFGAAFVQGTVASASPPANSASFFVNSSGTGSSCSQASPCPTIGQAIANSRFLSNTNVTITVAAGTYHESVIDNVPSSDGVTIQGAGASSTILSGGSSFTPLVINVDSGRLTVAGLTITGGTGSQGGNVLDQSAASVTFTSDTISNGAAGAGGGIAVTGGNLTLSDDTFSGDQAQGSGGGLLATNSTVTLTDDTFAGNGAGISGSGSGGALSATGSSLSLVEDTISGSTGGGLVVGAGSTGSMATSLLAGNGGGDCGGAVSLSDAGHNVADDATCALGGSSVSSSPNIGSLMLAANGSTGPQTEAITTSSSAFAEVPPSACVPALDERGTARPGSGVPNCDAGAFELQGATQTVTFTSNAPSGEVPGGPVYNPTATGGGSGNPIVFSVDPSSAAGACVVTSGTVSFTGMGNCVIDATQAGNATFKAGFAQQTIPVGLGTQAITFTSNPGTGQVVGQPFTATATGGASGNPVVFSTGSPSVCAVSAAGVVTLQAVGTCTVDANQAGNASFAAAPQVTQSFPVGMGFQNINFIFPPDPIFEVVNDTFVASYTSGGSGNPVTFSSGSPSVCTVNASGTFTFIAAGTCLAQFNQAGNANYNPAPQATLTIPVGPAEQAITITSAAPTNATVFGPGYAPTASGGPSGNPVVFSVDASSTPGTCVYDQGAFYFTGLGTCVIDANQAGNANYLAAPQQTQSFPVGPTAHGYWLVGADGGIFTFGSAHFYGSTGNLRLNKPVVGITPTADNQGYWLVASDGGLFSFGDSYYYGSIPGLGLAPAGSSSPHRLNAPIVGMVPSVDGQGYFMVGADGGVFAFGDAQYEGSCPGIGGCSGNAVAVVPDTTGNGYWVVTSTGHVYAFGDAPYLGSPGPQSSPVTSAVSTPDGGGYWILFANGNVDAFGDASLFGGPTGSANPLNPANAIFAPTFGGGYWVATANGGVYTFGGAPFLGSMTGVNLNAPIIAGTGF